MEASFRLKLYFWSPIPYVCWISPSSLSLLKTPRYQLPLIATTHNFSDGICVTATHRHYHCQFKTSSCRHHYCLCHHCYHHQCHYSYYRCPEIFAPFTTAIDLTPQLPLPLLQPPLLLLSTNAATDFEDFCILACLSPSSPCLMFPIFRDQLLKDDQCPDMSIMLLVRQSRCNCWLLRGHCCIYEH